MKSIFSGLFVLICVLAHSQASEGVSKDLAYLLNTLHTHYIYMPDRDVDPECLLSTYGPLADSVASREEAVEFFGGLLMEFGDPAVRLLSDSDSLYRRNSAVHVLNESSSTTLMNLWNSQVRTNETMLLGAEVTRVNGEPLNEIIDDFPLFCTNKRKREVRSFIANSVIAGKGGMPIVLKLRLIDGSDHVLHMDSLVIVPSEVPVSYDRIDSIGYIRINDSLNDAACIEAFDLALDTLMDTQGLILDLRNTVSCADEYTLRGIAGRFIQENHPFEVHSSLEKRTDGPTIERIWTEYVVPRGAYYDKSITVLVGKWTRCTGESLAIGLEEVANARLLGTKMGQIPGSVRTFTLPESGIHFQIPVERVYSMGGTPREEYFPKSYFLPTLMDRDQLFERALLSFN